MLHCTCRGAHSSVAEYSSFLGCDAVFLGKQFPIWLPALDDKGTSNLQNIKNHSPNDKVSHPRSAESLAATKLKR
jgi:hypothetical protein